MGCMEHVIEYFDALICNKVTNAAIVSWKT